MASISTQKDRHEAFKEEWGVLWPLREYLEQKYPQFHYLWGYQNCVLRIWKKSLIPMGLRSRGDIIKVFHGGKIKVFNDEYVWLAKIIAEKYNELKEATA